MISKKVIEFLRKGYLRHKAYKQNKPEVTYRLSCNSISLTVYKDDIFGNHDANSINWKEVKFVFVYKEDLLTVDRICMYLGKSPTEGFVVHEEMEGWNELESHLSEYLPGTLNMDSWWGNVVFPAFATNLTLVYKDPAYPDSEIQKMMKLEPQKKPHWSRFLIDLLLYISSLLPWVLCFLAGIASYQKVNPLLLKVVFWLGAILVLPGFFILIKAVLRIISWGDLFKNNRIGENISGVLFVLSVLLYGIVMVISLSVSLSVF